MKSILKISSVFALAFFVVSAANVSLEINPEFNTIALVQTIAFATGDGGDAGTGDSGGYVPYDGGNVPNTCTNGATNYPYCNNNVCTNGATNYPYCNNNVCTNGATNYPACNNQCVPQGTQTQYLQCPTGQTGSITQTRTHSCPTNTWSDWATTNNTCQTQTCINGATNFPYCNVCPPGQYYINGSCTHTPPTCSNGATNFPYCNQCPAGMIYSYGTCINQPTCTNGATNYPWCNNNVCTNGATNFPACNNQCTQLPSETQTIACGYGQSGSITQSRYHSCPSNTWSSWTTTSNNCQNNTCTNGATNYPSCNNNVCTNGTTNYPYCNQCPAGQTFLNGTCTYHNPTCTNGATNYPWCNNNVCSNGATNYPSCNNNITWCNGVQYYSGYICPTVINQNNLAVSTTGANPLSTTATIYGYVNPYNTNATIWFDYGTTYSGLQYQTTRQNTSSSGQFTAALSNLQCGTTYYYRAAAQNSFETKYGSTLSFVTPNCYVPPVTYGNNLVITRLATKVSVNSAQLNGSFINNSNDWNSCVSFFDYGTNYSLTKRTVAQKLYPNYKTNYFSQAVYGLAPSTTYYYRAGATCNDGTKFGQIYKFTTPRVYVQAPAPVTVVADNDNCDCEIPEYMNLTIDPMEGEATIGKIANYRINFKNVSESAINNVVVRVTLPDELTIAGADRGQFTKGAKNLVLTIPMLRALEEGFVIISTNVSSTALVGQQIIVNVYADYTTPTVKKYGNINKGEVTAYTISVAGNGTAMNPNPGNTTDTNYPTWLPQNLLEWLVFLVVIIIFLTALRYVFSVFFK